MRLAVIPARGGSKRIPRKNIRKFLDKPIIAYSIEAAKQCGLFDRIIVSTDDLEIARVANEWGAETPFLRPAELADDYTSTNEVIRHAIQWHTDKTENIDYACCIYATAPFLRAEYLQTGLQRLVDSNNAYTLSVTSFPFSIQRALRLTSDNTLEPMYPQFMSRRSQDLVDAYHDAGQFCWGKAESFLNAVDVFSSATSPIVLPRYLVQDIDTPEDWMRAEFMYQALKMSAAVK